MTDSERREEEEAVVVVVVGGRWLEEGFSGVNLRGDDIWDQIYRRDM